MKTIQIMTLLMALSFSANSQITLEHTYDDTPSISMVDLASSGKKYIIKTDNSFTLYNLNHSVFKTTACPSLGSGCKSGGALWVTENLFDTDNGLEYMLSCNDSTGVGGATFNRYAIVNEDQTILWSGDSVLVNGIFSTSTGVKMIVTHLSLYSTPFYFYGTTGSSKTDVYSLPGSILKSTSKEKKDLYLSSYPNPASNYTTIQYELPAGDNSGEIKIFTLNGVFIRSYDVDQGFSTLIVDTSGLQAGAYYYTLSSNSGESKGNKLIVSH